MKIMRSLKKQYDKVMGFLKERYPWAYLNHLSYPDDFLKYRDIGNGYAFLRESNIGTLLRIYHEKKITELDKPVDKALATILHSDKDVVVDNSFKQIRSDVIEAAIQKGIVNNWIVSKDDIFKVVKRPSLKITCPRCDKIILAHEKLCWNCGFDTEKLILTPMQKKELDLIEKGENGLRAFFTVWCVIDTLRAEAVFETHNIELDFDERHMADSQKENWRCRKT